MRIRLLESLRAVFYAPYYAAIGTGAFEREGIEVELHRPPHPAEAVTSLFDGRADVTWGGPMRMMGHLDRPGAVPLVGFAEAVTRDPFYLVGSRPNPAFKMGDLMTARVATVSEVPTPWLCLQDDLRRAGLDPAAVDRVADQTMGENVEDLKRGAVDVIQVFEPYTELLLDSGAGHLWYAAAARGPTSYTTLYTPRTFAQSHPDGLVKLAAGLYRAQRWIHAAEPADIAAILTPYFEDLAPARLASMAARYRANGVWGRNPLLPVVGFVRLKCALLSGAFISSDIPFDACMDNRYAREAMAKVDAE